MGVLRSDNTEQGLVEQPSMNKKESKSEQSAGAGGLPWGVVAAAAAGTFLWFNKDRLSHEGGFFYIIGAIALGVMSANMLGRK